MDSFRYAPTAKPCVACGEKTKSRKGKVALHQSCDTKES
jgi:hypothetical protein